MEINLADEVEQMAVAVDEARQNRFAFGVNHAGAARNRDFAALADRFDAFAFDDDDRVFDGRLSGGIDQRAALNHQRRDFLRRAQRWQERARDEEQRGGEYAGVSICFHETVSWFELFRVLQKLGISLAKALSSQSSENLDENHS